MRSALATAVLAAAVTTSGMAVPVTAQAQMAGMTPAANAPVLPGGPAAEVQRSYKAQKDNILKSADKMPAEDYSYKPTPDIRVFARILTHVIEAQVRSCGAMNHTAPEAQAKTPAETAAKAEIVAALKASFDECDKAYAAATDANVLDAISLGRMSRTRITLLWGNVSHDNEQYSQIALYMRLKGVLPPTASEK